MAREAFIERKFSAGSTAIIEQFAREGVEVRRLALNMSQVEEYNPPPNPAKEALEGILEMDEWAAARSDEEANRDRLAKIADNWSAVSEFLEGL